MYVNNQVVRSSEDMFLASALHRRHEGTCKERHALNAQMTSIWPERL